MNNETKIQELEAQCDALKAEITKLRTPPLPEIWTPSRCGDHSINGDLSLSTASSSARAAAGNSFASQQAAQPARRILGNTFTMDYYRREFDPNAVQDWSDKEQQKWYPVYNHATDSDPWCLTFNSVIENPSQVYFGNGEGQVLVDKLNAQTVKLKLQRE